MESSSYGTSYAIIRMNVQATSLNTFTKAHSYITVQQAISTCKGTTADADNKQIAHNRPKHHHSGLST